MRTILIATTSINRPTLHNDNIKDWYEWVNKVDKNKYNIQWFINIDIIEKLESSYEETSTHFRKIIKEIPIIFLKNDENKGNFLHACKRLSLSIKTYVNNNNLNHKDTIIFWLEDDWKLEMKLTIPLDELIETYLLQKSCINFTFIKNNYIHALAPSIINYNLWKNLHLKAWNLQIEHIDPEHCVGKYFLNNYYHYDNIFNLTIITKHKLSNINEQFFINNKFLNYKNSYYTYNDTQSIINHNYVHKNNLKNNLIFNDKIVFIRITCGFCPEGVNYGRNFMKNYDLYKKHLQNNENIDFYN